MERYTEKFKKFLKENKNIEFAKEIKIICDAIVKDAIRFSKQFDYSKEPTSDLKKVINDLKDTLNFLMSSKNESIREAVRDGKDKEKRFKAFIADLTKISNKHKIAISVTGGVAYLDNNEKVEYDDDFTSGDIGNTVTNK